MAFFCQAREYKGERRATIEKGENKTKKCFNIKLMTMNEMRINGEKLADG